MTSFLGNVAALAASGHLGMPAPPTLTRDPTWLQVEVCREYLRSACKRDNTECKYAHPSTNVDVQNGKVTVCFDAFKDRCTRSNCKYFHAPAQMKADLEMRGKMSLMRQKSEQLALQNHHQSSAAAAQAAVAQAAAQLALMHQLQQQQHGAHPHSQQAANAQASVQAQLAAAAGLHNPFIQPHSIFPNSAAGNTAIVQYHQILQQNYGVNAAPPNGHNPGALHHHTPVTVSSPPSNGIGGLSPPNGYFDPNNLALAVVNGGGAQHVSSAGSSPSPPKIMSTTLEVCREFSRGACPRSEDDCRYAHVHPDSNVAIDSVENRVTVCMDFVKSGGICHRQQNNNSPTGGGNGNTGDSKCKYFHPPPHLQEKFKTINNNNTVTVNQNNNNINVVNQNNNNLSVAPLSVSQQVAAAAAQAQAGNPAMLSPQTPAAVFTFQSPLNLQQSYANTSSLIPNYGKVLRLDSAPGGGGAGGAGAGGAASAKLPPPTPVTPAGTSPIGALTHPFNHFSNPGAHPPNGGHHQPPASPHQSAAAAAAFFYSTNPMYAAHLSAAQAQAAHLSAAAAQAANSNQSAAAAAAAALLPSANSPAFLTSPGATLMNGAPSSAALFANSGRYAAF